MCSNPVDRKAIEICVRNVFYRTVEKGTRSFFWGKLIESDMFCMKLLFTGNFSTKVTVVH